MMRASWSRRSGRNTVSASASGITVSRKVSRHVSVNSRGRVTIRLPFGITIRL